MWNTARTAGARMKDAPPPLRAPDRDEAYTPLEAADALPVLSLVLFSIAVGARPLVRLLPPSLRPYPLAVLLPVALALAAALAGALLAGWSLRGGRRPALARVALLANAVVVVLTSLTAAILVWIVRR
jgi:hypothetical protein